MTLTAYLTRRILIAVTLAVLSLFALAELLDLAGQANVLFARGGDQIFLRYVVAVSPVILGSVMPAATLIGAMAAFVNLARSNETVSLYAVGMGDHNIVTRLLPATAVLGIVYFVVQFIAAPAAELEAASILQAPTVSTPETVTLPETTTVDGPYWIRSGRLFLKFERFGDSGNQIEAVVLYRLGSDGMIVSRTAAPRAIYATGGWELHDVQRTRFENGATLTEHRDTSLLDDGPSPADVRRTTTGMIRSGFQERVNDRGGSWGGTAGSGLRDTRFFSALAAPLTPLIMVLAACIASGGTSRHPVSARRLGVGLVIGFGFLLAGGIFASLGAAGVLNPIAAAWTAPVFFLALTSRIAFRKVA